MAYYYLDIETYGTGERPNPETDTILTALICALDPATGRALQEPTLLTSWNSSEEDVVKQIYARMGTDVFDFIPVGFSLLFDLWFLKAKFQKYCGIVLNDSFYLTRPTLDLKAVAVLANKGQFKGVALGGGANIRDWYEAKEYEKITGHTKEKFKNFLEAYKVWAEKLQ